MSELDDMLRKKRAELPQAYELTGTEAGAGTVTAPKDMTDKQALDYDEAIRRQMDPARAEKSDEVMARIKAQAQEEHRKKIDKPRPTFFPQEEEPESPGKKALEKFFAEADKREPVSGDALTAEEEEQNRINAKEDFIEARVKGGQTREDAEKTFNVLTATKQEREIDEEQYDAEYADQDPVESSSAIVDGKNYHREVFEDGAVWLFPDDPSGSPIREEDVTPNLPEQSYKAAAGHATGFLQPSIEQVGEDSKGKPIYQEKRKEWSNRYNIFSGEGE